MKGQHTPARLALRRPWPGTLRGLILWLFGLAFIAVGALNYLGTRVPEPTRTYLALVLDYVPQVAVGLVFLGVGGIAIFTSYCHFDRDQYGYVVASVFSALWGSVYICGWRFYDAPARALGGAVVWLLYSAILTTCAQIPKIGFDYDDSLLEAAHARLRRVAASLRGRRR